MRFAVVAGGCLAGLLGCALAASAEAPSPPQPRPSPAAAAAPLQVEVTGDAVAGRRKAETERCVECHGVDGQGVAHGNGVSTFAKLAGQRYGYIVKQLRNFQRSERKASVMQVMAQHLDSADIHDLAAHFSTLPPMRDKPAAADTAAGQSLYLQGDPARQIVACVACHASGSRADSAAHPETPILAGQDAHYLEQQMLDWRSGWRSNSVGGAMNQLMRPLNDADIRALAGYLASQASPP